MPLHDRTGNFQSISKGKMHVKAQRGILGESPTNTTTKKAQVAKTESCIHRTQNVIRNRCYTETPFSVCGFAKPKYLSSINR